MTAIMPGPMYVLADAAWIPIASVSLRGHSQAGVAMASSRHVVRVVRTADRPGDRDGVGSDSRGMTAFMPAPAYALPRAAWIPTLVIWHADGRFTRLEGDPCEDYAAARAASRQLRRVP